LLKIFLNELSTAVKISSLSESIRNDLREFSRKMALVNYVNILLDIATGYGLDSPGSILGNVRFFLLHSVQPGSGTHPASYLKGTEGCFPKSKAARA
jgi:hypothetical protein